MDSITLKLDSPITEEQWDMITDVDFDATEIIWFNTKHGKKVEFVKRKTGKWIDGQCSICGAHAPFWSMATTYYKSNYCPTCGTDMRGEQDENQSN